jgi:hypothetical protein
MLCFPIRSLLSAPNGLFLPLGGDFEGQKALFGRFSPLLASKRAAPFRPGCSLRRPGWSMDGAGCSLPGGGKTPLGAGTPLRPAGCSIVAGRTPLLGAGCPRNRPGCRPLSRREDPAARREHPATGSDHPARRGWMAFDGTVGIRFAASQPARFSDPADRSVRAPLCPQPFALRDS